MRALVRRSVPTVLRCGNDGGRLAGGSWRPGDHPSAPRPNDGTRRAAEPGRGGGDGHPRRAAARRSGPAAVVRPGRGGAPGIRGLGGLLPAAVAAPAPADGGTGTSRVPDGLAANRAWLLAGAARQPALGALPAQ